jgi:hypothetical protein
MSIAARKLAIDPIMILNFGDIPHASFGQILIYCTCIGSSVDDNYCGYFD